jgi:hypothetical protein
MAESIFVLASMFAFAMVGLLTGWLHGHGDVAGTVTGGLGGLILAIIVPAMLGSSFMGNRRHVQYGVAAVAFVIQMSVVWIMYRHEFQ